MKNKTTSISPRKYLITGYAMLIASLPLMIVLDLVVQNISLPNEQIIQVVIIVYLVTSAAVAGFGHYKTLHITNSFLRFIITGFIVAFAAFASYVFSSALAFAIFF